MRSTRSGARCYLCVSAGFDVPLVLGSASTHVLSALGGFNGRPLRKGDLLQVGPCPVLQIRDQVREGKSLSEAVEEAGVFSKVYSTAILAGEKSGNLPGDIATIKRLPRSLQPGRTALRGSRTLSVQEEVSAECRLDLHAELRDWDSPKIPDEVAWRLDLRTTGMEMLPAKRGVRVCTLRIE